MSERMSAGRDSPAVKLLLLCKCMMNLSRICYSDKFMLLLHCQVNRSNRG